MNKIRFNQYEGADIISALAIAIMEERKKTVHPCMLDGLIAFIQNPEVELWYDGDHISQEYTEGAVPLYTEGFDHLCSSFEELNMLEQMYLCEYINNQHVKQKFKEYGIFQHNN